MKLNGGRSFDFVNMCNFGRNFNCCLKTYSGLRLACIQAGLPKIIGIKRATVCLWVLHAVQASTKVF